MNTSSVIHSICFKTETQGQMYGLEGVEQICENHIKISFSTLGWKWNLSMNKNHLTETLF